METPILSWGACSGDKGAYVDFYLKDATYFKQYSQQYSTRNTKLNYYLNGKYWTKRDISPTATTYYPEEIESLFILTKTENNCSWIRIENASSYEFLIDYIVTDGILISQDDYYPRHRAFYPDTDIYILLNNDWEDL